MTKIGDFSFCGNLPTYKPTRHCAGIVSNSQLYIFFTLLTVLQIGLSIFLYFFNGNQENFRNAVGGGDAAPEVLHAVVGGVVLIWIVTIVFSLIGYCENITYLHFPLAFIEIPFILISIGLTAVFCWKISLKDGVDERLSELYKAIVCFVLALFHVYYTWILYFLWKDGRNKRRIDEFIQRQRMIDDVCEEMLWEEEEAEEAHRYAELNHSRLNNTHLHGIYEADECSLYSQNSEYSVSISSAELRMMAIYNESMQTQRRYVSFYDPSGEHVYL